MVPEEDSKWVSSVLKYNDIFPRYQASTQIDTPSLFRWEVRVPRGQISVGNGHVFAGDSAGKILGVRTQEPNSRAARLPTQGCLLSDRTPLGQAMRAEVCIRITYDPNDLQRDHVSAHCEKNPIDMPSVRFRAYIPTTSKRGWPCNILHAWVDRDPNISRGITAGCRPIENTQLHVWAT